jgi:hypothetical protein
MSRAIADVPVRTESVPTSEFGATTDIRQAPIHEHLIGLVLLGSANNRPLASHKNGSRRRRQKIKALIHRYPQ